MAARETGGGRDPAGWFVRRAGLARFTTFACGLGLALSALIGAHPVVALAGLMAALAALLVGLAAGCAHPAERQACFRTSRRVRLDLSGSRRVPVAGGPDHLARGLPRTSRQSSGLLIVSVLLVGLFAGYLVGNLRVVALLDGALESRVGETVEAELCITGQVRSSGGWLSATAVVRRMGGAGGSSYVDAVGEAVLLEVAPAAEVAGARGSAEGGAGAAPVLVQGMILVARADVEAPRGPSDSGYDQREQLLHQGIEVVFRVEGAEHIRSVGRRGGVAGFFDRLREAAKVHLSQGPSSAVNEVLQGVVMGDTTGIDQGWMTAFRRSGTAHMLSVSGLHVAALAAIMIGLARLLRAPRWAGFLLAAIAALLMIPFVGASPPIIRSAAMICVVVVGRWIGRGRDQWQVLAFAAVVVLGLNPFAVFDVGFQLSFSAFVGMLVLIGPVQRLLRRLPTAVASNVAVSIAASAGTAPVALLVFDQTSLVSPLANLLVVPTLPLVTALGMASVFLGFIWTGLSAALDTLASLPMMWTIQISRLMAIAPVLGTAHLGRALASLAVGAAALPAALALTGRLVTTPAGIPLPFFRRSLGWVKTHRPRSRRRAAGLGAAVVMVALMTGAAAYPPVVGAMEAVQAAIHGTGWPDQVEIRVLDVGQGNAVLVRTPEHHALLFDGGPAGCGLAEQLRDLGVRKLDLAVISHPHADHFAGLLEALGSVEVEALIDQVQVMSAAEWAATAGMTRAGPGAAGQAEDQSEAEDYLAFRRELAEQGCRYAIVSTGDTVSVDGVTVDLYAPREALVLVDGADPWEANAGEPSGDELNGASVVAVVSVGIIDVLVPGDAEAEVLARYDLPATEVVVVPHHGSRAAVSARLLEAWGARVAFISVGEGNHFGHPDNETVSLLETSLGTVLRTDMVGWISCKVNESEMVITTERTPTW